MAEEDPLVTRTLELLDETVEDVRHGRSFYDDQYDGLGSEFAAEVDLCIQSLLDPFVIHQKVNGFHRLRLRRFPFMAYYVLKGSHVRVVAILDTRQNPYRTQAILKSRST